MSQASNTPPDGDFVRYIDKLTAPAPAMPTAPTLEPKGRQTDMGKVQPAKVAAALVETPFFTHIKWVIGLWLVTQVVARLWSGAGFLFIPLLIAYAAWVLFRVKRTTSGALVKKIRELAESASINAAEEVHKTRQANQTKNNKP